MDASKDIRSGLSKFTQYLRRDLRRIFSLQYQLSELKKLARLFRLPPVGTLVLVCLTMAAFVMQTIITGGSQWVQLSRWVQLYGTLPPDLHHLSALIRTEPGQALPVWLTLLTYLFVHGSWDHILGNTVAGWVIGNLAERRFGTRRFLLAYFAGGVLGAFGVAWLLPGSPGGGPRYGASLAWCYVLGAYWALLASDTARRKGRGRLLLAAELAALVLLACRFSVATAPSALESLLWVHPLPIAFGWFSIRICSPLKRLSASSFPFR